MPELNQIYAPFTYSTVEALKDWMIRANVYGFVSRSQGLAIVQKLTPMLPVVASLTVRTNKSMIYMQANDTFFRISQRGEVIDKPWNPNPRRPARNPWAD
jgi:hypothetical protein